MKPTKNWIFFFVAVLLYIPLGFIQVSIDYSRKVEDLDSRMLLMPGQVAGSLVLSGFKGIAADLLWLNVETYWHNGEHYKMLPLLESVAWLQPTYITVWAVGGWHMAYNIFASFKWDSLSEEINQARSRLTAAGKVNYGPLFAEADAIAAIMQQQDKQGMAERIQGDMVARLAAEEVKLAAIREKVAPSPLADMVGQLLEMAKSRLFWYQQGVQFLKKGVTNNRNQYDVYFELGWTFYHKGKDYPNAVKYLERATRFPHPDYVDNVLGHAFEKAGRITDAIKTWEFILANHPVHKSVAERMIHDLKTRGSATP